MSKRVEIVCIEQPGQHGGIGTPDRGYSFGVGQGPLKAGRVMGSRSVINRPFSLSTVQGNHLSSVRVCEAKCRRNWRSFGAAVTSRLGWQ